MSLPKIEVVPVAAGEQVDPSTAPPTPENELAVIAEAVLEGQAELDRTGSRPARRAPRSRRFAP